ncbi:hypothetical protein BD779DRAFT_1674890 [Infundibulicybe gibba]|nr:hypothetical protein BD779DRAFT_1674890 [Infundibulicybe gibba]
MAHPTACLGAAKTIARRRPDYLAAAVCLPHNTARPALKILPESSVSLAAFHNNAKVVKWFLARGSIDVNSKDSGGRGPLAWAAHEGSDAAVKLLLDQDDIAINPVDLYGNTPMDYAIQAHHDGAIELLRAVGGCTSGKLAMELRGDVDGEERGADEEEVGGKEEMDREVEVEDDERMMGKEGRI